MNHQNHRILPFCLLFLVLYIPSCDATAMRSFEQWYPEWSFIFDRIIRDNCSAEYEHFQHGDPSWNLWYNTTRWMGAGSTSTLVAPLTDCILDHSSEYMKSSMAAANVVLGLTPSLLASLGSDVEETAVLAVCSGRWFLAMCLSAGSPAVMPKRLFQYQTLSQTLSRRPNRSAPAFHSFHSECLIWVAEHLIVLAAIANVAMVGYELGCRSVLIFAPHLTYLVFLWIFFGTIPYMSAAVVMKLRISIKCSQKNYPVYNPATWVTPWKVHDRVTFFIRHESLTCALMSGLTSILISCHIILGTLVFSSMLFISVRDAIPIIARFLASVIACRVVLMYELSRFRYLCSHEEPRPYDIVDMSAMDGASDWVGMSAMDSASRSRLMSPS